ncbi:MAG: hypothetical protein ACHQ1H_00395 [Nitrososphaerales archaeon]
MSVVNLVGPGRIQERNEIEKDIAEAQTNEFPESLPKTNSTEQKTQMAGHG